MSKLDREICMDLCEGSAIITTTFDEAINSLAKQMTRAEAKGMIRTLLGEYNLERPVIDYIMGKIEEVV